MALLGVTLAAVPAATTSVSVGAFTGYGEEVRAFAQGRESAYRLGVGGRAGVTLGHVYLGGAYSHHVGTSVSARGEGVAYESYFRTRIVSAELGWNVYVLSSLILRPQLGVGRALSDSRATVQGISERAAGAAWHLTPALLAIVPVGHAFVGAEVRAVLAPLGDPLHWAPAGFVTVGLAFD